MLTTDNLQGESGIKGGSVLGNNIAECSPLLGIILHLYKCFVIETNFPIRSVLGLRIGIERHINRRKSGQVAGLNMAFAECRSSPFINELKQAVLRLQWGEPVCKL